MNRTRAQGMVASHLPGWRVGAEIADEPNGVLCEVQRFNSDPFQRGLKTRTVWVDNGGAVDATIDDRGYIVTKDGRRF